MVIQNLVFSDDIVNMLIELVYPMILNLIDEMLTDAFINNMLEDIWDGLDNLVSTLADNGTSWLAVIYGTLAEELNVILTPAGMAWIWNKYGYTTDSQYNFCDMKGMHDMLKAAKGGKTSDGVGHSTGDYEAIGCMYDPYYMDHWKDVKWEQMVWNINGSMDRFLLALDAALAPLAPLLAVVLGDAVTGKMTVTSVLLINIHLVLNEGNTFKLYNNVLVPLFETLGITMDDEGLLRGEDFEAYAQKLEPGDNVTATDISNFLNKGILSPLLKWVTEELLEDPIQTVMGLVPNLSYYLTSGALMSSVQNIEIPIKINIGSIATISVYTLNVADLLGDALDFLTSVQGILELINFSVDTGKGLVGYYSDTFDNYRVFTPDTDGYDPEIHNIPTEIAYANAYGEMNLYESNEYYIEVTAQDADGKYTEYAIKNTIGYYNTETQKIVDNMGSNESLYIPLDEYYSYDITEEYYDPVADEIAYKTTTYKVRTLEEVPEEYKKDCELRRSYATIEEDIALPPLMEYKLQACGTLTKINSARYNSWSFTNMEGGTVTWDNHSRPYIVMSVTDKNGTHDSHGLVFLFLLRYILSALGYSDFESGNFVSEYTLLDAFGLDDEMLNDELISGLGLTLGEIIYHVCLNPDGIISALFELFTGGEQGSLYTTDIVDGVLSVVAGKDYSYAPKEIKTYAEEILSAADEHDDYQYGTAVLYNEYWTKEDGEYIIENLDGIAENVLGMLKLEGSDSLSDLLEDLLADFVFNNDMVTMIVNLVYSLLGSLEFDLGSILNELLGVDYSKQAMLDSIAYMFKDVDYTSIEMYKKLRQQINNGDYEYTDHSQMQQ